MKYQTVKKTIFYTLLLSCALGLQTRQSYAADVKRTQTPKQSAKHDTSLPTTITSDSLKLKTRERKFTYYGNVEMVQGEMKLNCDELQGSYNEDNEIKELTALKNVVITKGEQLEARGDRADFDNKTQVVIMTENPLVIKGKSQLNADKIFVYLETEQTVAEGRVQMKILQDKSEEKTRAEKSKK